MKLLLVKTSSLGDILHTLPAVTDACRHRPDLRIHWIVEEAFARIPPWSPMVEQTIPLALRRWRKQPWQAIQSGEIPVFFQTLRASRYDLILDAQGLIKSALIVMMAKGPSHGLDRTSIREPLAAFLYRHTTPIPKELHAVERIRLLFASALGLPPPEGPPDFGLDPACFGVPPSERPYLMFLHGTTWFSKQWPEPHWYALAQQAQQAGMTVQIPWGSVEEKQRAQRIQETAPLACRVLPKLDLNQLAAWIVGAQAVIAVDSGPAHLAAALGTPTLCLYGPTPTDRIGILGRHAVRLSGSCPQAPCCHRMCPLPPSGMSPDCLARLEPNQVWNTLETLWSCP
ncbi:MAG: lipopolysaccharide heptosyltransferase I [Magnetococcus sp. YQC-5]